MSDALDPARYSDNGVPREEHERRRERFWTAASRGAAAGCILRGGLSLFASLTAFLSRKQSKAAHSPLGDVLRMAMFLGGLAGSYVLVDEAIAATWGKQQTSSWRAFLAGLCAGPSLLFLGRDVAHNSLAMYVLARSVTLLVRCGNRQERGKLLYWLLSPTRMKRGDVLLMCLAGMQILYSYVMMPHTLPKSYRHFLNRHVGQEPHVIRALQELVLSEKCANDLKVLKAGGDDSASDAVPCGLLHPNMSCVANLTRVFPASYLRSLMVYLPVYLAPALLVHRKKLMSESRIVLPKVLKGVLRSSLFLSSFITVAYAVVCALHNAAGRTNKWTLSLSFFVPGIAVLVEKESRRMELALYSISRAAECLLQSLEGWGVMKPPKRFDVLLFSIAVAIITHCYSDDEGLNRHSFKSKYLNVLDFVFGNSGIQDGAIHHAPSNQDLLQMGSHWWSNGLCEWLYRFFKNGSSSEA